MYTSVPKMTATSRKARYNISTPHLPITPPSPPKAKTPFSLHHPVGCRTRVATPGILHESSKTYKTAIMLNSTHWTARTSVMGRLNNMLKLRARTVAAVASASVAEH